jgi:hypothetical protein
MLAPRRRITFTSATTGTVIVYDFVCELEIDKGTDTLTDTATITIPRKLIYKSGEALTPQNQNNLHDYVVLPALGDTKNTAYIVGADALFKRGDKVKIELCYGYDNDEKLKTRFEGFITGVSSTLPITITCEDKMWLLKQTSLTLPDPANYTPANKTSGYNVDDTKYSLAQLLDIIVNSVKEKITYTTVDDKFDLGNLTYSNQSAAQILQNLKDTHGLYSYFKDDGSLYVGFYNDILSNNIQEFAMEEVVTDDKLTWVNADDVSVKVQGISTPSDKTKDKVTYEAYYKNGNITDVVPKEPFIGDIKIKNTKNQNSDSLKKMVVNFLPTYTYTGFKGEIETLGEPLVNHGDVCYLTSKKMPERNGYYLIKGVKIRDGIKGYFQTISLGIALYKK